MNNTKNKDNQFELSVEEKLKIDLSKLLDSVTFIKQNDDCSNEERAAIDEQLLKLQDNIKNVLEQTPLHKKIKEFISAIKRHRYGIKYFDNIKDQNPELYSELLYNFKEGMIAQSLLYKYFNLIYKDDIFPDNRLFLKILQDKDEMFNTNPSKNPRYKRKKRYKVVESKFRKNRGIRFIKKIKVFPE